MIKEASAAAAQLNDALDHDWAYIEERCHEIEEIYECMDDCTVKDALGIVISQCYLNMLKRVLIEHGAPLEGEEG